MSRKLKKGYFVRGEFIAEGSERDLELKAELKGTTEQSRTDLKRESTELQKLGADLLELRPELLARLALSDKFKDAILDAKRITNFEGKRRQLQFIGKLMRQLEPDVLAAVRAVLDEQANGSAADNLMLHQAETWRDQLLADEDAAARWIQLNPRTDSQQLRALIRQARKDALPDKPEKSEKHGGAVRHGRAYREIFQLVREALSAIPDDDLRPGLDSYAAPFSPAREAS
ncbi:MAG: DUF615 domain-containing protein [Rhodoferax sp.]|jgi:ribosome-associated protein|nr:DUF615 domain-containing protein [Rhodoferax sp.]